MEHALVRSGGGRRARRGRGEEPAAVRANPLAAETEHRLATAVAGVSDLEGNRFRGRQRVRELLQPAVFGELFQVGWGGDELLVAGVVDRLTHTRTSRGSGHGPGVVAHSRGQL